MSWESVETNRSSLFANRHRAFSPDLNPIRNLCRSCLSCLSASVCRCTQRVFSSLQAFKRSSAALKTRSHVFQRPRTQPIAVWMQSQLFTTLSALCFGFWRKYLNFSECRSTSGDLSAEWTPIPSDPTQASRLVNTIWSDKCHSMAICKDWIGI